MLSGVGEAAHLSDMGIPAVHCLPGVGNNLKDHIGIYLQYKCKQPITLFNATWRFPHKLAAIGWEYATKSTGIAASSHMEVGAFIRRFDSRNLSFWTNF